MNMRKEGIADKDFSNVGQHIEDSKLLEPGAKPVGYENDTNELRQKKGTFPDSARRGLGVKGGGK